MAASKRQTRLRLALTGSREQLMLTHLDCYEGLSEPFMATLEVLSKDEIKLLPNLGKAASVECLLDGEHVRYFHGVLIDAHFAGNDQAGDYRYSLTLAPLTHLHEQGSNFRIYQNKTVIAIIEDVLGRRRIPYKVVASGGKRKLPYCVQYGESDFAFVCRLLEEAGLYYFYRHEAAAHRLMICDKPSSHRELPAGGLHYNPLSDSVALTDSKARPAAGSGAFVQSWSEHASTGGEAKVTMRDFDFKHPAKHREAHAEENKAHEEDTIEIFRWPGRYYQETDGTQLSQVVLESRRAQRLRYEGTSRFPGIQPGYVVTLDRHPIKRFNRKYLITRCRTQISDEQFRSGGVAGETSVQFTATPDHIQYRAPIVTPRPAAKGPETAIVTGPPGEEIHVDEFGRIKVQFHWDRKGKRDDNSSCWLRVSQTGGLGNIIIPRIGHEVLVDFINGNPDRPIVVGRVFNAGHMPVYPLPGNKTRAVWRTKSYKLDRGLAMPGAEPLDSGQPGANEIRFEDATGQEELYIHAEKDLNSRTRNNETHHVGRNVEIKVGKSRNETVGENETILVKQNRSEQVLGSETIKIVKDRSTQIDSNDTLKVKKKIVIDADQEIEITAKQKITITVGKTSITLDPTSLKLATTLLDMQADANAKLSGGVTNVEAKGILTAKGAIVMIN